MDGNIQPVPPHGAAEIDTIARGPLPRPGQPTRRPKTVRWMIIVGLLLALVLGALYGFNRFREHAIASYFASNKPPPAQISAVTATTAAVPQFAGGIGSLAAVHQVTVTPEVGGRIVAINFEAGSHVKAGDLLLQINDAPDKGDLANYQAQARMAQLTLQRNSSLATRQFATQESVDQAQSQLDQAKAQMMKTDALIAQKQVRAPFSGRLGVRQVEVGQYLNPGAPIVTLTDLQHLYVNFTLPTQQRTSISVGQKVKVTADSYPGRSFEAKITTIEPQIRADTRTIALQATMDNPDEVLMPGMFVEAAVVLPPQPDQVTLPETAVDYTLYGDSVYVIREDGKDDAGKPILKAFRTPVKTGARWDGKVAVLSGVKAGDQVVAAGQLKVQNGGRVAITGNPPPQPPEKLTPQ